MKFTVDRTAFLAGLTLVLKAAGPRNAPLAVLENVLVEADADIGGLQLTCCNLEATFFCIW
jgi:DNA polymerase III sliding clamp (beta) subunit (PCNA family)